MPTFVGGTPFLEVEYEKVINMKRIFALIGALVLTISLSFGQANSRKQDLDQFLKTTTYIVLDNNPMSEWNMKLREYASKHWHITPIKFISDSEFESMRQDIDKSFIVRMKFRFPGDKVKANYIFFSIVNGSAVRHMTDMPEICSVPLGYETADQESWSYKLGSLLQFAQKHIKLLQQKPELMGSNVLQYYNKHIPELGNKEIWVVEQDLAPEVRSLTMIRNNYKGVVRIVSPEDIVKAIDERRTDVVYLHKVGPERSNVKARIYKCLIGAGDDVIYYFDYHMMSKRHGDGFLRKDFRRLNRRS